MTGARLANAATFVLDHHTVSVSEEARSSVIGPLRRRVETLHHGIDVEAVRSALTRRAATREALGIGPTEIVAAQVANFRREKAHEVLVDAAGQGQRFDEIDRLVAERGLDETVRLLGYRDDVHDVLAASDLLVLSSDHEGLPVAVMESLALGIPVVATAVGGLPEAITHDVEGLLVAPRSPIELADAVERVATDADLRARLGSGAAERGDEFDASAAVARLEKIYREVLGR